MKAIAKFTDDVMLVRAGRSEWCLHLHRRSPVFGATEGATAAVIMPARDGSLPRCPDVKLPLVRRTCFGPCRERQGLSLQALREAVGGASWSRSWRPRLRMIFGEVFDMVLLARALSCVPRSDGRVTIELGVLGRGNGRVPVLRVIGYGWRVAIAGRLEREAPALELPGRRTRHAA